MPDGGEEVAGVSQNIGKEPHRPSETEGNFKDVHYRYENSGIDLLGKEYTMPGSTIFLEEAFKNPAANPLVYFETRSGTICRLSLDKDLDEKPTLNLLRSNRPKTVDWYDIAGKISIGESFLRIGRKAGSNDLTSLETSSVKRIVTLQQTQDTVSPNIDETNIVSLFEQQRAEAAKKPPEEPVGN